jgi:RimJ/RimL family protein N-acetyltransferase
VLKSSGNYIGYCGVYPHFNPHIPIPGEGTLGYYLARPHWGRGLASEAGMGFVAFGFRELGLSRLVASIEVGNAASVRVLEKLGFTWHHLEPRRSRSFDHYELRAPGKKAA